MNDKARIGNWVSYCCSEDLTRINSQEDVDDILDDIEEGDSIPMLFETKEEALRELD